MSHKNKRSSKAKPGRKPKKKCCLSKPRCTRCPLRMLAEGTLPDGYTVRKRKLVKPKDAASQGKKGKLKKGQGSKGPQPA